MFWTAANGGVTNGGLRGPPVLFFALFLPFSPFFCLFHPFSGKARNSTWGIQITEGKGLFPQISPDLHKPRSLKPPFAALQRFSSEIVLGKSKRGLTNGGLAPLEPQIFRENWGEILPGKSGLFGANWVAISAASYRGAKCPTLKTAEKGAEGVTVKQPKNSRKNSRNTRKTVKTAVFRVFRVFFPAVFRLFYRDPSAPFSAVFPGCFQCRAFGTSVAGRRDCKNWGLFRAYRGLFGANRDQFLRTPQPRGKSRNCPERAFFGPIGAFRANCPRLLSPRLDFPDRYFSRFGPLGQAWWRAHARHPITQWLSLRAQRLKKFKIALRD